MRLSSLYFLFLVLFITAENLPGQGAEPKTRARDPKTYIQMMESPERISEQKPDQVIAALGIRPGEVLADIGAGSGFFSFRFARHVGNGRVYAVDIDPDMILHMNRKIRDLKLRNVTTVLSAPDDPLLPESADRFFICNTWHHIQNRRGYLTQIRKTLRPGGQLIIIDYKKKSLPVGPPPEMKLARRDVVAEIESHGFKLVKEHRFLDYQYFLVFSLK